MFHICAPLVISSARAYATLLVYFCCTCLYYLQVQLYLKYTTHECRIPCWLTMSQTLIGNFYHIILIDKAFLVKYIDKYKTDVKITKCKQTKKLLKDIHKILILSLKKEVVAVLLKKIMALVSLSDRQKRKYC